MSKRRDRLTALAAALLVVLLVAAVVTALLTAERNGRKGLEDLQLAQMQQLARVFDGAFRPALASPAGLLNPATGDPWSLVPGDPTDKAGLERLQSAQPALRTGYVLVDANGIVTNGTLLVNPSSIGQRLDRPNLDQVLKGTPMVLPAAPNSLTTPLLTIAIARPFATGTGPVRGAILQESDVAPDSAFTAIMAGFRRAKTDEYAFIDSTGLVVASTNAASVGNKADPTLLDPDPGFHRHGSVVAASAEIPSVGWHVAYRQSTEEFEGDLTGPLRSALLLLSGIGIVGAVLAFFVLYSRLRAARREQARLGEINEAREEFISIVSHELRTPAAGQFGFLQTLLDHWDSMNEAERRQTVTQAYANARRLHALSRDVLDTASIESGELPYTLRAVDLRDEAQSAVDAVLSPDHEISLSRAETPVIARVDPERIQQVLANMLDNAVKNSPGGSRIDVRVGATDTDARVEVSDRGFGLTDEDLERAFEKFSRGRHASVTGTGLGLYICRKIIDTHGGRTWAERRQGGGLTVVFTIPLATPDSAREPEPALRSTGP